MRVTRIVSVFTMIWVLGIGAKTALAQNGTWFGISGNALPVNESLDIRISAVTKDESDSSSYFNFESQDADLFNRFTGKTIPKNARWTLRSIGPVKVENLTESLNFTQNIRLTEVWHGNLQYSTTIADASVRFTYDKLLGSCSWKANFVDAQSLQCGDGTGFSLDAGLVMPTNRGASGSFLITEMKGSQFVARRPCVNPFDLNRDGKTGPDDFNVFRTYFDREGHDARKADFNLDTFVDVFDLHLLIRNS